MFSQLKKLIFKLAAIELSPQERGAHEESERVRREIERKRALEQTQKALEKELTLEEIPRAQKSAEEREETKPYGQ